MIEARFLSFNFFFTRIKNKTQTLPLLRLRTLSPLKKAKTLIQTPRCSQKQNKSFQGRSDGGHERRHFFFTVEVFCVWCFFCLVKGRARRNGGLSIFFLVPGAFSFFFHGPLLALRDRGQVELT